MLVIEILFPNINKRMFGNFCELMAFVRLFDFVVLASVDTASSNNNQLSCSFRDIPIFHGDSLVLDECACHCDNSTMTCNTTRCPIFCGEPVSLEGQCCDVCSHCKYNILRDESY